MTKIGSSNAYRDLGLPDADEYLLKARLTSALNQVIRRKNLTETDTAEALGLTPEQLSSLLHDQFQNYSLIKMMQLLTQLSEDISIVVMQSRQPVGRINVISE